MLQTSGERTHYGTEGGYVVLSSKHESGSEERFLDCKCVDEDRIGSALLTIVSLLSEIMLNVQ